jgi:hypothetical protein
MDTLKSGDPPFDEKQAAEHGLCATWQEPRGTESLTLDPLERKSASRTFRDGQKALDFALLCSYDDCMFFRNP